MNDNLGASRMISLRARCERVFAAAMKVWERAPLVACAFYLSSALLCISAETSGANADPSVQPSEKIERTDLLQFIDGSSLHGKLGTMAPGEGVAWEHPDAKSIIHFRPTNIAWIRFEKPRVVSGQAKPTSRFRFNNGDEIFGTLESIDQESITLNTWFGGSLKTPRHAAQSITFLSKGYTITYEGPTSAEGWVSGKSNRGWEYRDGAFLATGAGTIGRDFKLAASSSISFDLAWNGHFSLILALYTSLLDRFDYSSSSYMYYLSPGYISLQRVQGGAGAMNLGQTPITEMASKNKLHMEIRASKEDSTLTLLVDGRIVHRWKDSAGFVGQGSGAVFFAQLDGPSIKISNIKVAQWEGDLTLDGVTNAPTKEDLVLLVNRDKVNGRLQGLRDQVLSIVAGETPLDIPLSRVSQICMAGPVTNTLSSTPWGVRAYFAGGGTVAFELNEWRQGSLSGTSANFGPVQFDAQYVRQLQFNLFRTKLGGSDIEALDLGVWDLE